MRVARTTSRPVDVRDIAAEALTLAGGGRALLLQIAHPAVGRGVVEHSDFATRLLDRFDSTMLYLTASMFGTPEELRAMRRIVNRAHAPVRGGTYNAYDPELQLWVAATLYDTMMDLHRRVYGPLSPAEADAAYRDLTRALSNLQLSPDRWPPTRQAFAAYWDAMIGTLRVDDEVLAVSRQILFPGNAPLWIRPALPMLRLLTTGLLPATLRAEFRLPWDARRQWRFDRLLRWTTTLYPRLPQRLRHLPRDRYLARLRAIV
jgi:uncharacterized protein (DUF2236 family)